MIDSIWKIQFIRASFLYLYFFVVLMTDADFSVFQDLFFSTYSHDLQHIAAIIVLLFVINPQCAAWFDIIFDIVNRFFCIKNFNNIKCSFHQNPLFFCQLFHRISGIFRKGPALREITVRCHHDDNSVPQFTEFLPG